MKALLLSSVRTTLVVCVSLLLGATPLYSSSSTGGAPGRSDVIKRREKPSSKKSVMQAADSPAPPETRPQSVPTRFVWVAPSSSESTDKGEVATANDTGAASLFVVNIAPKNQAGEIDLNYGDVLNAKQKASLQARAEALGIQPGDYARLLTDEEKQRLDAMLVELKKGVATGE